MHGILKFPYNPISAVHASKNLQIRARHPFCMLNMQGSAVLANARVNDARFTCGGNLKCASLVCSGQCKIQLCYAHLCG
eukprot:332061-Pelagomonas_calceolata.AAC.1